MAETSVGGTRDDEASEAARTDSAGEGIPEDGRCARLAAEGQDRGTGLCSGTWQGCEPTAGLYGVPGLSVPAFPYRSNGMVSP